MKQCWIGILLALLLIFSLTACKDANNAAQPLPTAGSGGKLPEISKTETGDMNRDSSESSAVPDGKPDMIPPSDKEAAAVSVSGSGAEYPASEQAFERLRETEIVRYYLELGMVMLDTGLQETVNGQNCRIISLGTDHETHFVQEIYYAVSCDTIYTYDQINDEWLELGSEPSIPGAEFAMSDLEGSWQMVEGEVEGWRYSAADEGIVSTLCFTRIYDSNIPTTDLTADFDRMDENGNEAYERNMEVKFLDELLYYGCPNEAWSVQLLCEEEGVSYFVAITDPDTLELYFSFEKNGNSGASLAYYRRI